ncbi:hypothetical protein FRC11_005321 [Ceratobasidium sp. 423]|nr:hypothetical protein FRC11_005321 [Ceratobasidium sp. 423]
MSHTPETIVSTSDLGDHAEVQPLLDAEEERHVQAFNRLMAQRHDEILRAYETADRKGWSDWRLFRRMRAIRERYTNHMQAERRRHEQAVIDIMNQA